MSEGQVSETSMMSTTAGADSIPGTDDGVPPADAAQAEVHGMPRDYSQDEAGRSGLDSAEEQGYDVDRTTDQQGEEDFAAQERVRVDERQLNDPSVRGEDDLERPL